jgi:hypothetical protein
MTMTVGSMESYGATGHHHAGAAAQQAGTRRRRTGPCARRAALAVLATLAALTAAGCGGNSAGQAAGSGTAVTPSPTAPAAPQETSGSGSRSGVNGGALFGGNAKLVPEEAKLGRRLAIVRVYYQLGESFPRPADRRLMAEGTTLLVSLDTVPGDPGYASIAAGHQDATIMAFIRAVNQAAVRYHLAAIYFCFEHEANALGHHQELGSPAQFIQAWDHIRRLAESADLDWNQGGRIHWVWILTYKAFAPAAGGSPGSPGAGSAAAYWPGSNQVDIVAADGYDNYGCTATAAGNGKTPGSLFDGLISFAKANGGLPVFITEWASTSFSSRQRQAAFISQMQAFVAANREIAAVLYWNGQGAGSSCNFSIDGQPASVTAMAAMGHSPALQGRLASG